MASRTAQRRAAVWALYQSDLLGRPLAESFPRDVHEFTKQLASATYVRQPELDQVIEQHSTGWSLGRIAPLERSVLRVALLEMLHPSEVPSNQPIPAEGAIVEAVETAKEFCGADAPKFINGVLGAVLREMQTPSEKGTLAP